MKTVLFALALIFLAMFAGCAQSRSVINVTIESKLSDSVGAPTVARIEWQAYATR